MARFDREMKAIGRLNHPNLVQAYDARDVDGTRILVMEYVDGVSVTDLLRRTGPLRIADACEIVRQAALGLQYAHEHGMVHRDIKPSNLMLARGGQVKILDMGLALLQGGPSAAGEGGELTSAGQAMGTAEYMAPEQAADSHSVDIRADIYSLGCTLYKLLTGQSPFSGPEYKTPLDKITGHLRDTPRPVQILRTDVPDELAAILGRMLAKSPAERFATPAEVAGELGSLKEKSGARLCERAELSRLLAELQGTAAAPPAERPTSDVATDKPGSSALAGTQPSHPPLDSQLSPLSGPRPLTLDPRPFPAAPQTAPKPARRRWKPWAIALGLVPATFALAVVIWINRDGRRTKLEVPDNTEVEFQPDGSVEVRLPEDRKVSAEASVEIRPEPLQWKPGAPIPGGLVLRPAPLPGVLSWTVEPVRESGVPWTAAFSPDGKWLAYSGEDGAIRVVAAETGNLLRLLVGHEVAPKILVWSPCGRYLASGENRFSSGAGPSAVRIWEPDRGTLVRTVPISYSAERLAWSPEGKTLAMVGWGMGQIRLWHLEANNVCRSFGKYPTTGYLDLCLAWSPDGKRLAATLAGRGTEIWDGEKGTMLMDLPSKTCRRVVWSPDGKVLAETGLLGDAVRIWESGSGKLLEEFKTERRPLCAVVDAPLEAAFTSDGEVLLIPVPSPRGGAHANAVSVLRRRLGSGQVLPEITLAGLARIFAWSPDRKRVFGCGHSNSRDLSTIAHIDSGSSMVVEKSQVAHGEDYRSDWTFDGKMVAIGTCNAGKVHVLDGKSGRFHRAVDAPDSQMYMVACSPDATMLAVRGRTAIQVMSADLSQRLDEIPSRPLEASWDVWSPDSRSLAVFLNADSPDARCLLVRHIASKTTTVLAKQIASPYSHLAWSPDGKHLAASREDGKLSVWDVERGSESLLAEDVKLAVLYPHYLQMPRPVAWSPDGTLLAASSSPSRTRAWNVKTGQPILDRQVEGGTLAFSADSGQLALGAQGACYVWDLKSGNESRLAQPGTNAYVFFSPDGKQLTTAADGVTTSVWDIASRSNLSLEKRESWGLVRAARGPWMAVWLLSDRLHFYHLAPNRLILSIAFRGDDILCASPEGHYFTTMDPEKDVVYVVLTDDGRQTTLAPEEFSKKYGWKNDPGKVRLDVPSRAEERAKQPEDQSGKRQGTKQDESAAAASASGREPGAGKPQASGAPVKVDAVPIEIRPEPLQLKPGAAIPGGLVLRPAPLPGVLSWTVEPVRECGVPWTAAFSPDGKWLAYSGADGAIRVVAAETGRRVRLLVGHEVPPMILVWSPCGRYLASGDKRGPLVSGVSTVRIWEPDCGRLVRTVSVSRGAERLAWSPDGKTLAILGYGTGQILLWDLEANDVCRSFGEYPASLSDSWLAWSADGKRLAGTLAGNGTEIWDAQKGTRLVNLPSKTCRRVVWSPDGMVLAETGLAGDPVRVWETGGGKLLKEFETDRRQLSVSAPLEAAFTRDGEVLLIPVPAQGSEHLPPDAILVLRRPLGSDRVLPEMTIPGLARVFAWSPDRKRVFGCGYSTSNDLSTRIADIDSGSSILLEKPQVIHSVNNGCRSDWTSDGKMVAVGTCGAGKVHILDGKSGRFHRAVDAPDSGMFTVACSPDATMLAVRGGTAIHVMSADLAQRLDEIPSPRPSFPLSPGGEVWSPDSRSLAVFTNADSPDARSLLVRHIASKTTTVFAKQIASPCSHLAWSPDNKYLAASCEDGRLSVWDVEGVRESLLAEDVKLPAVTADLLSRPRPVAWSPDGTLLAASSSPSRTRVWNIKTAQPILDRKTEGETLAFSADSGQLALGANQACYVWNLKTGEESRLAQPGRSAYAFFSPDGKQLTTAVDGVTTSEWDIASRSNLSLQQRESWGYVRGARGPWMAVGLAADRLHFYHLAPNRLVLSIALRGDDILCASPEGHYFTTMDAENDVVYVVLTDDGRQTTLTPEEFSKKYGWKNDPGKARLGDAAAP
ncbi:MAG: PD40 domain-containing protein [Pirellulales bacterium]|nr:PD40 domain-containing protein [Pirellulales bacterium]